MFRVNFQFYLFRHESSSRLITTLHGEALRSRFKVQGCPLKSPRCSGGRDVHHFILRIPYPKNGVDETRSAGNLDEVVEGKLVPNV